MEILSFLQEHQQSIVAVSVILAGLALYAVLTRKSKEIEALEREYQEIVQPGKQSIKHPFSAKAEE